MMLRIRHVNDVSWSPKETNIEAQSKIASGSGGGFGMLNSAEHLSEALRTIKWMCRFTGEVPGRNVGRICLLLVVSLDSLSILDSTYLLLWPQELFWHC